MTLKTEDFSRIRPYLFHLTAKANIPKIRNERILYCSAILMSHSPALLKHKRAASLQTEHNGVQVQVRDQAPLHLGNIRFEGGWTFADLLQSLNGRVFFWPGKSAGPIPYGVRHFCRYRRDNPVILRVRFDDVINANPECPPEFCKFNSGSPRCTGGQRSPRGPNTFLSAQEACFSPASVVEVTFPNRMFLPSVVEFASSLEGPWQAL